MVILLICRGNAGIDKMAHFLASIETGLGNYCRWLLTP
jgi:hypothetical protein